MYLSRNFRSIVELFANLLGSFSAFNGCYFDSLTKEIWGEFENGKTVSIQRFSCVIDCHLILVGYLDCQ